jgi:uncharacterized protein YjiS (DUF1127 family)
MLSEFIRRARRNIDRRHRYNQAIAEINALSARDLSDMRADRGEMLYRARKDILG